MFIDLAPPLNQDNGRRLAKELREIGRKLSKVAVDVAFVEEPGIELVSALMIWYVDDQDDDEDLARHAESVIAEFHRLQAAKTAFTKEYGSVREKIGPLKLRLDRDGA